MTERSRYLIPIEGNLIEVEKEVYDTYYQMDRRSRYLDEQDQENGVVSYQVIEKDDIDGEAGLPNPNEVTMEEQVIVEEMLNRLYRCIASLPRAERELILAIYFEDLSTKDYAKKKGMSRRTVDDQRSRVLSKMREIMKRMDEA